MFRIRYNEVHVGGCCGGQSDDYEEEFATMVEVIEDIATVDPNRFTFEVERVKQVQLTLEEQVLIKSKQKDHLIREEVEKAKLFQEEARKQMEAERKLYLELKKKYERT